MAPRISQLEKSGPFWHTKKMSDPGEDPSLAQSAAPFRREPEGGAAGHRPQPEGSREVGGPTGPEPTRFGDWERNGRCIDF
jgi:hypothetical protein